MVFKRLFFLSLSIFYLSLVLAQPSGKRKSKDDYIKRWKEEAQRQMIVHGIPASITLAQGILESNHGNSPLARYANNHFGIKCHDWDGRVFLKDDDNKNDCFRRYDKAIQSFVDHSLFLKNRSRYEFLFQLEKTDYKGWAKGLKKAGYATNPKYPQLLIEIIKENDLHKYDKINKITERKIKHNNKNLSKNKNDQEKQKKYVVKETNNDVEYVIAKPGDNFKSYEEQLQVRKWQIKKYNNFDKTDSIKAGNKIYLQPKRNRSWTKKYHYAKKGETMWEISQKYAIKLDKLYNKNAMEPGTQPEPGQKIHLKQHKHGSFFKRLLTGKL